MERAIGVWVVQTHVTSSFEMQDVSRKAESGAAGFVPAILVFSAALVVWAGASEPCLCRDVPSSVQV